MIHSVAGVIYIVVGEIHHVVRVVGGLHCVAELPDQDIVRLPLAGTVAAHGLMSGAMEQVLLWVMPSL